MITYNMIRNAEGLFEKTEDDIPHQFSIVVNRDYAFVEWDPYKMRSFCLNNEWIVGVAKEVDGLDYRYILYCSGIDEMEARKNVRLLWE